MVEFVGEFFERSYLGNLSAIQLNGYYAAALFEGKIELHIVGQYFLYSQLYMLLILSITD